MSTPALPNPSTPPGVPAILAMSTWLHAELERAVLRLRLAGATWSDIGRELGVSSQAAHKRWRYLDSDAYSMVELRLGVGLDGKPRASFRSAYLGEELPRDHVLGLTDATYRLREIVGEVVA